MVPKYTFGISGKFLQNKIYNDGLDIAFDQEKYLNLEKKANSIEALFIFKKEFICRIINNNSSKEKFLQIYNGVNLIYEKEIPFTFKYIGTYNNKIVGIINVNENKKNIMYIKAILIIIFCSLLCVNCNAQIEKKIQGTIVDSITNMPLEGVYIKISNSDYNAITNKSGYFSLSIDQATLNNDSIIINGLGYKTIKLPISIYNNEPIRLFQEIAILPEVIVQSLFNWDNFVKKIKLEESTTPFESDIQKSITIKKNTNPSKEYIIKGYAHDEGLTLEGLKGNIRGRSFNYGVFFNIFSDTTSFINYNGSREPQIFTDLEWGQFYWLFLIFKSNSPYAECKITDVTSLGGDSIYVINYKPKIEESKNQINKINRRINRQNIGNINYLSLDKTIYIRKKDFTIMQIDFIQRNEISNADTSANIKNIREISGSVKFEYFNGTPHPVFLNEKYIYEDKYGNVIEREDKVYYCNIQMIRLSEAELKKKYQLAKIFQTYPRRQFNQIHTERIGPFFYVPTIK